MKEYFRPILLGVLVFITVVWNLNNLLSFSEFRFMLSLAFHFFEVLKQLAIDAFENSAKGRLFQDDNVLQT